MNWINFITLQLKQEHLHCCSCCQLKKPLLHVMTIKEANNKNNDYPAHDELGMCRAGFVSPRLEAKLPS